MTVELYDFQKEDVAKLKKVKAAGIWSEMGVGKTHEAIELIMEWTDFKNCMPSLEVRKPAMVIAPLNTHKSWVEKFEAQAPHIRVFRIDRKDREDFIISMLNDEADVYLCHWQALVKMPWLAKFDYSVIVGDEIHRISNINAKTTKAAKLLKSDFKLAMSGTAAGDKPDKFQSVLEWLMPDLFGSYWGFRDEYIVDEIGDSGYRQIIDVQNTDALSKIISPFSVRHLKREACCDRHPNGVMDYLPDKTYDTVTVQLLPKQRRIYDEMQQSMTAWLGEHQDEPFTASVVIAQLTRLSQMALATPRLEPVDKKKKNPWYGFVLNDIDAWSDTPFAQIAIESPHLLPNVEDEYLEYQEIKVILEAPSTKINALQEIVEDHPDKPFVVFSSSKQAVKLAKIQLEEAGIKAEVLSGETPQAKRDWMIDAFQRREFQVFIGVIAACGEGIDGLQNVCDTVIFLDESWTSYENKQAVDRLDRPGQKNTISVIKIVAEDTVDEYRQARIATKWNWFKKIIGDIPEVVDIVEELLAEEEAA